MNSDAVNPGHETGATTLSQDAAARSSADEDAGLLQAFAGGDARAFENLYRKHRPWLYRVILRQVGNEELAEGIFQEVWLTVTRRAMDWTPEAQVATWLYGIARRTILHYHRRNPSAFVGSHDASYVPTAGPEDAPGLRLTDDKLEECCTRLPSASLEILQLALWHSLTLAEIGHVVGLQQDRVRRLASDGLSLLSLALKRGALPPS